MSINFPHHPDIRLERSPLDEVICQVRFPAILRITKENPSEFQDLVRENFPLIAFEQGFSLKVPKPGIKEDPSVEALAKIHRFQTADEKTVISLAVDFFALSTKQYTHWSDFIADLELAKNSTQQVYQPAYATRIGLRYTNRFTLKNTGFEKFDQVLDIFQPNLVAMLKSTVWSQPAELLSQLVLTDNSGKLTLRTGFGIEKGEGFFLLDLDYFEEGQLILGDLLYRVQRYHSIIYDAFRWCIKEDKLAIFSPIQEETK